MFTLCAVLVIVMLQALVLQRNHDTYGLSIWMRGEVELPITNCNPGISYTHLRSIHFIYYLCCSNAYLIDCIKTYHQNLCTTISSSTEPRREKQGDLKAHHCFNRKGVFLNTLQLFTPCRTCLK